MQVFDVHDSFNIHPLQLVSKPLDIRSMSVARVTSTHFEMCVIRLDRTQRFSRRKKNLQLHHFQIHDSRMNHSVLFYHFEMVRFFWDALRFLPILTQTFFSSSQYHLFRHLKWNRILSPHEAKRKIVCST